MQPVYSMYAWKKHGLLQVVVALENKVALFLEKNISSMQKSVNRKSLYWHISALTLCLENREDKHASTKQNIK